MACPIELIMLLFLKTQLVSAFSLAIAILNPNPTTQTETYTVFQFDCEDGPEVIIPGQIFSISTQNAEVASIQEKEDHAVVTYQCHESSLEGGITIIAVEDMGF